MWTPKRLTFWEFFKYTTMNKPTHQHHDLRHSLAHILAAAVLRIFPEAKLGIGPVIEDGFYYDFDLPRPLIPQDLLKIEKEMRKLISQSLGFVRQELSVDEAKKLFAQQPYKLELIRDLATKGTTVFDELENKPADKPSATITAYTTGKFVDLCRGGHLDSTKLIKADAFKLTRIAGAYWRGDEKNPMLQRIYGVAFPNKKELDDYRALQEEMKKRDHRKLGSELDLFFFSDLVGKGLPLLTPHGSIIRRELERFTVDEEIKNGYQHIYTPPLAKTDLYKKSGHYPYYKDTMYPVMQVDEDELILRPMTCPHHFMEYQAKPRSYRELPMKLAEISPQFRYEKSGELSGLMRVRMFTLADAHIFCAPDQASREVAQVLRLIDAMNGKLGLKRGRDYIYRLSLGDRNDSKKYYKDDTAWEYAEGVLRAVLKKSKAPYYEAAGEAAFYGPKIDVQMKKINGQEDTAFTVQYDFVLPKRFALTYTDATGTDQQPVVIHRASIGCLERTIAFLIEHYAGALPIWLSPIQVAVIPVGKSHRVFAAKLHKQFLAAGLRSELAGEHETVGYNIRQAEKKRVPYMLVIGDKEKNSTRLHVRIRGKKTIHIMTAKRFVERVLTEITEKK